MRRFAIFLLGLIFLVTGCNSPQPLPTVANPSMVETAAMETLNAPPPGMAQANLVPIEKDLSLIANWHYQVVLTFEGTYADTREEIRGVITADVYSNELAGERRVVLRSEGAFFGDKNTVRSVEGVRLGNQFYFVDSSSVCKDVTRDAERRRVAELTAGSLIGGVRDAEHTTTRQAINGVESLQYSFKPGGLDLTGNIKITQGGQVTVASGELWIAPQTRVVQRYGVTLNLSAIILDYFSADRQLNGRLQITYNLMEIGQTYNIAIPFGC
jgi:hypothetical protein